MHNRLATFLKPLEHQDEIHFELLHLPAGGKFEANEPEDIHYYVMRGIGTFQRDNLVTAATQGRLLHAPAGLSHGFHRISRDLMLIVMPSSPVIRA